MSRKYLNRFIALCLVGTAALGSTAAQETNISKPELATMTRAISLWPGIAPGSEQWKQQEAVLGSDGVETMVNVTTPTLTAYLPDSDEESRRRGLMRVQERVDFSPAVLFTIFTKGGRNRACQALKGAISD